MMDHWEIMDLYKALFSVAAGTILGLERELKDKAAGLKTINVICLGSTLFTILSYKLGEADHETTRIASYIVSGIGFIGAGVIFKNKLDVSGLTTAGIIWLASAVGMAIGFGEFYLAATFVGAALLVIILAKPVNRIFRPKKQKRMLMVQMDGAHADLKTAFYAALNEHHIEVDEKQLELSEGKFIITVEATVPVRQLEWLEKYLLAHEHIHAFMY